MTDMSDAHLHFQGPKPAVSANTDQLYGKMARTPIRWLL